MSQHVFARVSGYGWTILPHAPFSYHRLSNTAPDIILTHTIDGITKQATLIIKNDGYHVELAPNTQRVEEIADITPNNRLGDWIIETSLYTIAWPYPFSLVSPATPNEPSVFDLIGVNDMLIYVQGPFWTARFPELLQLASDGQRFHAQGMFHQRNWVEFIYDHANVPWIQRHYCFPNDRETTWMVTMQAPQEQAHVCISATERIVQTFQIARGSK